MTERPMWRCPRCGRRFANRNQSHSCVRVPIRDHLAAARPEERRLFRRFASMVRVCGPFTYASAKTRIGFQVRMIFADIEFRKAGIHAYVILARRLELPRFTKIESIGGDHVHHFDIRSEDELDDEVQSWLCEAYRVGRQDLPRAQPGSGQRA